MGSHSTSGEHKPGEDRKHALRELGELLAAVEAFERLFAQASDDAAISQVRIRLRSEALAAAQRFIQI